jgi:hypothetical protein
VATGLSQDEWIFTGYSQVPQQKKRAFFDMDRKWLKERGKGKSERGANCPTTFSLQSKSLQPESLTSPAFSQPMTLTTQPTVAP